jgi:hypothetical protein
MPYRSKGRDKIKYFPWFSRLEFGRGANDPTSEKLTVKNLQRLMEEVLEGIKTHIGL